MLLPVPLLWTKLLLLLLLPLLLHAATPWSQTNRVL
jgi:hypothetical protein